MKTAKRTVTTILLLSLLLMTALPAQAAPRIIVPYTIANIAASLSANASDMTAIAVVQLNGYENMTATVTLQRSESGSWKNYETLDSCYGYKMSYVYNNKVAPPKGYSYRIKLTFTSTSFSTGVTQYSQVVPW